jgi:DHA1 family bicyclomycin/chloramphenicol resistance-like MFS transporter
MRRPVKPLPLGEFIPMLALTVSLVAMSTDVMLPALGAIGADLGVADVNDTQLIVTSLFLGFGVGQLFAGPLSDSFGRKRVIYVGFAVFIAGCLISMLATNFTMMIVGRVLQGLGAAGPRVVPVAIVRDGYEGRAMARIMSFVMAVFILVPTIAPAIGQWFYLAGGWRATFQLLLGMALLAVFWFGVRQPETLPATRRRAFSVRNIALGVVEVVGVRSAVGYTLCAGLIFGVFMSYLGTSRQVFQDVYDTGTAFPYYFGAAAITIGIGSIFNGQLVMRFGMRRIAFLAFLISSMLSAGFSVYVIAVGGLPPLMVFMTWLLATFSCMGFLFGNLNALAMEHLGHIAGLGAAFIGFTSTMIALPLGWLIGQGFDGGVLFLTAGFAGLAFLGLIVMRVTEGRWG